MEKVEFKRIEWPQSSSILAQGLQAYNLAEGKKMANASANFYAMVHKESNLVVVTA